MKKIIALILTCVCLLYLVSCSDENLDEFEPDTDKNDLDDQINDEQNENDSNENENNTPVDNDAILKAELISKFGIPFRLYRTEGMTLWEFTINEDSAERGYHNSMEGSFFQKNLSWEIKNGELVITGDWNETFIIDLEEGQAISKTDEGVYKIVEKQN